MGMRNFQKTLESILRDDKRYGVGAYVFVRMELDFTVKRACAEPNATSRRRSCWRASKISRSKLSDRWR